MDDYCSQVCSINQDCYHYYTYVSHLSRYSPYISADSRGGTLFYHFKKTEFIIWYSSPVLPWFICCQLHERNCL